MVIHIAGQNLPPPQSPFVVPGSGVLSSDGYQYLLSLLNAATAQSTSTVDTGLTATGTNQATALQLNAQWNEVDTAAAGTGVLLESLQQGQSQTVSNQGANNLNVYPPPGFQIDALGENAPYVLAPATTITFGFWSDSQIRS